MMTRFNLASHPYENLRPRYLLAAMALVLAVVLAGILITRERQQDAETRSITQQMARFNQEMDNLAQQRRELDEWLRRPEVQEIREHSAFLNSLIARKSLSWTQMFLDLEEILPHNAQVTAIQPRVNRSQQQPELSLLVLSERNGASGRAPQESGILLPFWISSRPVPAVLRGQGGFKNTSPDGTADLLPADAPRAARAGAGSRAGRFPARSALR